MGTVLSKRYGARAGVSARWTVRAGVAAALLLPLAVSSGCAPARPSSAAGGLRVSGAFYPLQFVVERVGGAHLAVSNLTAAGAEPHDVELSARDLVAMRNADLVVYLRGLAPAVDEGVRVAASGHALDVAAVKGVLDVDAGIAGHGAGNGTDTHFWLDPTRLSAVVTAVADRLVGLDPAGEADYRRNAADLVAELRALDQSFTAGLATCASHELVTSHAAFGYLARRYGLHEQGITGLQPDAEPTASALADIADLVRERGVRTVYTETLLSGAVARTLADATGAQTAVLDPLEGLAADTSGDYLSIMQTNLATLRQGQGCT